MPYCALELTALTFSSSSSSSSSSRKWMALVLFMALLSHVSSAMSFTRLSRAPKRASLSEPGVVYRRDNTNCSTGIHARIEMLRVNYRVWAELNIWADYNQYGYDCFSASCQLKQWKLSHNPALIRESLKLPDHSFKSQLSHRLTATQSSLPPTSASASLVWPPLVLHLHLPLKRKTARHISEWINAPFLMEGEADIFWNAKYSDMMERAFCSEWQILYRFTCKSVHDSKGNKITINCWIRQQ